MAPVSDEVAAIAGRYERFAAVEVRRVSPAYEQLALAVAASPDLLAFLRSLPNERRQPNLFLAAVRHVCRQPRDGRDMEEIVRAHASRIEEIMLERIPRDLDQAR